MNAKTSCGLLAALVLLTGCASESRVQLTSYSDPYFPEKYVLNPAQCAFRYDAGGDCHVLAYSTDLLGGADVVRQWLHIHIFWKPQPGKTRDNPTSMDATVRFAVATAKGATLYSGTAFVFPTEPVTGGLRIELESGRLRLDRSLPEAPDLLGETRIVGTLLPKADAAAALDLQRQLDLAAGPSEE